MARCAPFRSPCRCLRLEGCLPGAGCLGRVNATVGNGRHVSDARPRPSTVGEERSRPASAKRRPPGPRDTLQRSAGPTTRKEELNTARRDRGNDGHALKDRHRKTPPVPSLLATCIPLAAGIDFALPVHGPERHGIHGASSPPHAPWIRPPRRKSGRVPSPASIRGVRSVGFMVEADQTAALARARFIRHCGEDRRRGWANEPAGARRHDRSPCRPPS